MNKSKLNIGQLVRIKDPNNLYSEKAVTITGGNGAYFIADLKPFDVCIVVSLPYTTRYSTELVKILLRGEILETYTSNLCTVSEEYLKFVTRS